MTKSKANDTFNKRVTEFVISLGGRENTESGMYPLAIDTVAGVLQIHPQGEWIACRFDDVQRAKAHLDLLDNLNPRSGKWNFSHTCSHGFVREPCFDEFKVELTKIV